MCTLEHVTNWPRDFVVNRRHLSVIMLRQGHANPAATSQCSYNILVIFYLLCISERILCLIEDITVPFRIVQHGLWPMTTALKFYFGRGQCDEWFWPNFGKLKFRLGMLKLANTLSQLAKDNVTRGNTPISTPSRGLWPTTRRTIRNGTVLVIRKMQIILQVLYKTCKTL